MNTVASHILAIDCGSTNLKAALFDAQLTRLSESSVPVVYTVHDAERVEFDAEVTWSAALEVIRQACRGAGVRSEEIGRFALASQAQTFTIVGADLRPQMPFVSWLDRRADAESDELAGVLGEGFHQHCSFSAPVPQLQVAKVLWVRRHHPELFAPGHECMSLPGFFAARLGGVGATDRNLAAMSGLYSLAEGGWWHGMLAACGVAPALMSGLVDVGESVAVRKPCPDLAVSPDATVVFAGNDQTAGAVGNGCGADDMLVTLGTALVAYRFAGYAPGPYHPGGCWGPYPGGGYYELATHDGGCAALDWAREQILPGAGAAQFDALAASAAPAGEVTFHPLRARSDSAWVGDGNDGQRARAVLEGIGFSLRGLIEDGLGAGRVGHLPRVRAIGGGSRSRIWLEIMADILNCEVCRGAGDALLGAARMAAGGLELPREETSPVMVPNAERAAACDTAYRRWQARE